MKAKALARLSPLVTAEPGKLLSGIPQASRDGGAPRVPYQPTWWSETLATVPRRLPIVGHSCLQSLSHAARPSKHILNVVVLGTDWPPLTRLSGPLLLGSVETPTLSKFWASLVSCPEESAEQR